MLMLLLYIFGYFKTEKKPKKPKLINFTYGYLRHPFDDKQFFYVDAPDQASADESARQIYTNFFNERHTVTTEFWRVN